MAKIRPRIKFGKGSLVRLIYRRADTEYEIVRYRGSRLYDVREVGSRDIIVATEDEMELLTKNN